MKRLAFATLVVCTSIFVGAAFNAARAEDKPPQPMKSAPEHAILKGFVGEWEGEMEGYETPDKPTKAKCTLSGKMIGDLWVVVSFKCDMGGQPFQGQGTFGYDATRSKKYTGTWIDSMTDFLWTYDGKVEGFKLIFDAKGPSMTDPTKMVPYRDTWEFKDKDQIILTSECPGPDGKMTRMMQCVCKRKK